MYKFNSFLKRKDKINNRFVLNVYVLNTCVLKSLEKSLFVKLMYEKRINGYFKFRQQCKINIMLEVS